MNRSPGRVVDILRASGAFDPGSSPGRGVPKGYTYPLSFFSAILKHANIFLLNDCKIKL